MSVGLVLALSLAAGGLPQQAGGLDVHNPIALFNGVCLADEVALPRELVADQDYDALPHGARDALGFAHPPGGIPRIQPPFALPKSEVPNRILAVLAKKQIYLLLATTGAGQYSSSCAVVWKGNHYSDAVGRLRSLSTSPAQNGLPSLGTGLRGLNYSVVLAKGMIVGAAELNGWTVLRVAPDLSQSPEQQSQ
jgi:hypothetical protein